MTTETTPAGTAQPSGELGCPFGAGTAPARGGRPKPKRGYLLPGTIALVVCAVLAVGIDLAGLKSHTPHTLAGRDVAQYVEANLQTTSTPPAVTCPPTEPLRAGLAFTCTVTFGGGPQQAIRVEEISSTGSFRITRPSPAG